MRFKMTKILSCVISLLFISSVVIFTGCESNDATVYPTASGQSPLTLLLPQNNSTINTTEPQFDWTDYPDALSYGFQLASDASFSNIIVDSSGLSASSVTLASGVLNDSSTYYWRVRAVTSSDTTAYTTSGNFSILVNVVSANNKVLIEFFTNTSCIPCVPANIFLDRIYNLQGVTSNDADVVMIRTHTTLFPNDPFYLYNTTANDARQNYYSAGSFNPQGYINGSFMGIFSEVPWTNLINSTFGALGDFALTYNNSYNTSTRQGTLTVTVHQLSGAQVSDLVLNVALTENELMYSAPNGETEFENTLRDLLTPTSGEMVTVNVGQSATFTYNYTLDSQIDDQHANFVMFVQSSGSKEVYAVDEKSVR